MKRKLRISITDRCNFRCVYCMPLTPVWKARHDLLDFEEIYHLAEIFVKQLGIERIRLTGGEPLARKGVPVLVEKLASLKPEGLKRLSITTNGVFLNHLAKPLKDAGLDDVNVSLDSLNPTKFARITKGDVTDVLKGIEEAKKVRLGLKVNTVVIRGMNDEEIVSLVSWAYHTKTTLRFIEFMPLDGRGYWKPELVVGEKEILERIGEEFEVTPVIDNSSDPARYYLLNGSFRLGVIPTASNPFCSSCDRVRITADGALFPCLFSLRGHNLKGFLRNGEVDERIISAIRKVVYNKPEGFVSQNNQLGKREHYMYTIGG